MEAKRRIRRAFYWIDTKLVWLLHFPKPIDWEEFDRKMKEAREEDARRWKVTLEGAYMTGMEEEAKGGHNSIAYLEGYQEGKKAGIEIGWEQAEVHYQIDTG